MIGAFLFILIFPIYKSIEKVHQEKEAERIRRESQFMTIDDPEPEDEFLRKLMEEDEEFKRIFQESNNYQQKVK